MNMQCNTTRARQRGLSLVSLVLIAVIAVVVFAIGGQSVPVFVEYMNIKKAAIKAAREGSTVPEVREIFDKAANIDSIQSIAGKDLEIGKNGASVTVSYSYSREIGLVGPAFLVFRFQDTVQGNN
jgi:beta-lactam-binding protein with PASTA domain